MTIGEIADDYLGKSFARKLQRRKEEREGERTKVAGRDGSCGCSSFGPCAQHREKNILRGRESPQRPSPEKFHLWYCTGCKRVGYVPVIDGETNALDTMKRMDANHRAISPDCYENVNYMHGWLVNGVVDVLREQGAVR